MSEPAHPIVIGAINESKLSICRVCLQSGDKFMSLFEQLGPYQVFEHIMSISVVTIIPADGLPDLICPPCLLELQTAITFKKKCEESDRTLRTIIEKADLKPEHRIPIEIKKEDVSDDEIGPVEFQDDFGHSDAETETKPISKLNIEIPAPAKGEKSAVQCNECQQFFRSRCKLRVHWKKEHKLTFVCETCKRLFKTMLAFKRHKKRYTQSCNEIKTEWVRVEGVGRKRMFHCTKCDYKSEKYIHLKTHKVVHMPGERPFKCKYCPKAFTQRGSLKQHNDEQHDPSQRPTCHVCGKVIFSRRRLYRHLQTHGEANIKCPICGKLLKTKSSIKNHMKRHSGTKEYTCELCAATYYTQAELCNHRRIHHVLGGRAFKCLQCDFACNRKSRLEKHEVEHGGDKPVPCIKCGRFYESLQRLHVHLVRYHKPRVVKCPKCPKIYCDRKSMRCHMRLKHGLKPNEPLPDTMPSLKASTNAATKPSELDGQCSSSSNTS